MTGDDRPLGADDELDDGLDAELDAVDEADDDEDDLDDGEDEPVLPGDGADIPQDMVELLEATADLDAPVEVVAGPGGTTYQLAERPFAWAHGLIFEAHIGPDIATAALRTPDVTLSPRGTGWIRLAPAVIDDHAADRMVAWFELARRIAVGRQARPTGTRRH